MQLIFPIILCISLVVLAQFMEMHFKSKKRSKTNS